MMKNKYIDQPSVQIKIVITIFIGRQDESILTIAFFTFH